MAAVATVADTAEFDSVTTRTAGPHVAGRDEHLIVLASKLALPDSRTLAGPGPTAMAGDSTFAASRRPQTVVRADIEPRLEHVLVAPVEIAWRSRDRDDAFDGQRHRVDDGEAVHRRHGDEHLVGADDHVMRRRFEGNGAQDDAGLGVQDRHRRCAAVGDVAVSPLCTA